MENVQQNICLIFKKVITTKNCTRCRIQFLPPWGGQSREKSLNLGFGEPFISGKQGIPSLALAFSHILRHSAWILLPPRYHTYFKLRCKILPYFVWESNRSSFQLVKSPTRLKFEKELEDAVQDSVSVLVAVSPSIVRDENFTASPLLSMS